MAREQTEESLSASKPRWPLERRWTRDRPVPSRVVPGNAKRLLPVELAPPWRETGDPAAPFDFAGHMRRVIEDIVVKTDVLHHVRADRLLIDHTPTRRATMHGLQARITPMRFENGLLMRRRQGRLYRVQRYFVDGREMLYVVSFSLPRFLNRTFDQKLLTIVHELYHISPHFNGDLRRFPGRGTFHTADHRDFDAEILEYTRDYLQHQPDERRLDFLRLDFAQLAARHGRVVAPIAPRPKILAME
jgi:hypothetical protein